jgi:hypothetical protein
MDSRERITRSALARPVYMTVVMRKHHKAKKLNISVDTIRNLSTAELAIAMGGHIKTRDGCTKKNSECNACPELEI